MCVSAMSASTISSRTTTAALETRAQHQPTPIHRSIGSTVQATNRQPFASIPLNLDPFFHSIHELAAGRRAQAVHAWSCIRRRIPVDAGAGNGEFGGSLRRKHPNDSYGPIGGITPQVLRSTTPTRFLRQRAVVVWQCERSCGQVRQWMANLGHHGFPKRTAVFGDLLCTWIAGWPGQRPRQCCARRGLYPSKRTNAQWFNPAAFTAPPCFNSTGISPAHAYTSSMPTTYDTYGTSAMTCCGARGSRTGT